MNADVSKFINKTDEEKNLFRPRVQRLQQSALRIEFFICEAFKLCFPNQHRDRIVLDHLRRNFLSREDFPVRRRSLRSSDGNPTSIFCEFV